MAKNALGKGLQALIPDSRLEELEQEIRFIPVESIYPQASQPRKLFNSKELEELAQSIKQHGIIQPLIVTQGADGGYELVAGERRLRAAKLAGLAEVPVVVITADENQKLELSLIENIQREDLNPIEEAMAYRELIERLGLTQEEVALRVGKDRSTVANALRLLGLPGEIKNLLLERKISAGHARALLGLPNKAAQLRLCRQVVAQGLSVRETEEEVRRLRRLEGSRPKSEAYTPPWVREVEGLLRERLATKVKLIPVTASRGRVIIEYYSLDELERFLEVIKAGTS